MLLTLSGRSFLKIQYPSFSVIPHGVPLPPSNTLQYYVKREKCKVNDVIFPSGNRACVVRHQQFFKHQLLLNRWANLDQTWQEYFLGGPL